MKTYSVKKYQFTGTGSGTYKVLFSGSYEQCLSLVSRWREEGMEGLKIE